MSFRGNSYSVPPGLVGTRVSVRHQLGVEILRTAMASGAVVAAHSHLPDGAGRVVRDERHVPALERAALAALFGCPAVHTRRAARSRRRHRPRQHACATWTRRGQQPLVNDLSTYAATAARLVSTPSPGR